MSKASPSKPFPTDSRSACKACTCAHAHTIGRSSQLVQARCSKLHKRIAKSLLGPLELARGLVQHLEDETSNLAIGRTSCLEASLDRFDHASLGAFVATYVADMRCLCPPTLSFDEVGK
eukprot:4942385-Amphidinium_carterae.1